jgi:hypothetical protein
MQKRHLKIASGATDPKKRLWTIDSEKAQKFSVRTPSPAVMHTMNQLLQRHLREFSLNCFAADGWHSTVAELDEDELERTVFGHLKRVLSLHNCAEDMAIGGEHISLEYVLDKIERAAATYGACAAVFVKNGFAFVIAKKDGYWVFVSLDRQSDKNEFRPGSHAITFYEKAGILTYLLRICDLLSEDVLEDDWHATLYCI